MEALGIAASIVQVAGAAVTLTEKCLNFACSVRHARRDMEAVAQELVAIRFSTRALDTENQYGRLSLPPLQQGELIKIVLACEMTMAQIDELLHKCQSGRLLRRITWTLVEKDEVNKFRSALESQKIALDVALSVITLRHVVNQKSQLTSIAQQLQNNESSLQNVQQQLGALPVIQRDTSLIVEEVKILRTQLYSLSSCSEGQMHQLQAFTQEFRGYAQATLKPMVELAPALDNLKHETGNVQLESGSTMHIPLANGFLVLSQETELADTDSMEICPMRCVDGDQTSHGLRKLCPFCLLRASEKSLLAQLQTLRSEQDRSTDEDNDVGSINQNLETITFSPVTNAPISTRVRQNPGTLGSRGSGFSSTDESFFDTVSTHKSTSSVTSNRNAAQGLVKLKSLHNSKQVPGSLKSDGCRNSQRRSINVQELPGKSISVPATIFGFVPWQKCICLIVSQSEPWGYWKVRLLCKGSEYEEFHDYVGHEHNSWCDEEVFSVPAHYILERPKVDLSTWLKICKQISKAQRISDFGACSASERQLYGARYFEVNKHYAMPLLSFDLVKADDGTMILTPEELFSFLFLFIFRMPDTAIKCYHTAIEEARFTHGSAAVNDELLEYLSRIVKPGKEWPRKLFEGRSLRISDQKSIIRGSQSLAAWFDGDKTKVKLWLVLKSDEVSDTYVKFNGHAWWDKYSYTFFQSRQSQKVRERLEADKREFDKEGLDWAELPALPGQAYTLPAEVQANMGADHLLPHLPKN